MEILKFVIVIYLISKNLKSIFYVQTFFYVLDSERIHNDKIKSCFGVAKGVKLYDCSARMKYSSLSANSCKLIPNNRFVCGFFLSCFLNVLLIIVIMTCDNYTPLDNPYLYNRSNWKHFSKEEVGNKSNIFF